jgi:hypothetical protein
MATHYGRKHHNPTTEIKMTTPTMTASQWWARHRQIRRIREAIDVFPDMTDEDGEVLAGCLSARLRCQDLTLDQEAAERWWRGWTSDVDTAVKRQGRRRTLAERVEHALETLSLPTYLRAEMTGALERLRSGDRMTPRQAKLWGSDILPTLKAAKAKKIQ